MYSPHCNESHLYIPHLLIIVTYGEVGQCGVVNAQCTATSVDVLTIQILCQQHVVCHIQEQYMKYFDFRGPFNHINVTILAVVA